MSSQPTKYPIEEARRMLSFFADAAEPDMGTRIESIRTLFEDMEHVFKQGPHSKNVFKVNEKNDLLLHALTAHGECAIVWQEGVLHFDDRSRSKEAKVALTYDPHEGLWYGQRDVRTSEGTRRQSAPEAIMEGLAQMYGVKLPGAAPTLVFK